MNQDKKADIEYNKDGLFIYKITYQDMNTKNKEYIIDNISNNVIDLIKKKHSMNDFELIRNRSHIVRFAKKGTLLTKKDLIDLGIDIYNVESIKSFISNGKNERKISDKGYWIYTFNHTIINESTLVMLPYYKDGDIIIIECVYRNGKNKILIRKQLLSLVDTDHMKDKLNNSNGCLQRTTSWVNQEVKESLKVLVSHKKITQSFADELLKLCRYGHITNRKDLDERIQAGIKQRL